MAETGGKGIKSKIMLDWAKEINSKRPGENTLDWAFLKRWPETGRMRRSQHGLNGGKRGTGRWRSQSNALKREGRAWWVQVTEKRPEHDDRGQWEARSPGQRGPVHRRLCGQGRGCGFCLCPVFLR